MGYVPGFSAQLRRRRLTGCGTINATVKDAEAAT
jgi:hypothetical protein